MEDRLRFLERENAKLKERIALLEAALTRTTIKADKSYRDLENKFDRLSKLILKTVVYLVNTRKRPVSSEEIIKAFKARYGFAKAETITRRLRYLKDPEWCKQKFGVKHALLHSPQKGMWIPTEAEVET